MRRLLIAVLLALSGGGSTVAASDGGGQRLEDSTLPLENVITKPDWLERPTADDLERYYPSAAAQLGLPGRATIQCLVNAAGRLTQCQVKAETPLGMGFGRAALNMAPAFRMKALTVDGAPVDGGEVTVPIRFQIPPDDAAPAAPPPLQPSSPAALALARQIQELDGTKAAFEQSGERYQLSLDQLYADDPAATPEEAAARQVALDAIRGSQAELWNNILDRRAAALAQMPAEQLQAVVAFLQSPAGKAYADRKSQNAKGGSDDMEALTESARAAARSRFCAKVKCEEASAPPAAAPLTKPAAAAPTTSRRTR